MNEDFPELLFFVFSYSMLVLSLIAIVVQIFIN